MPFANVKDGRIHYELSGRGTSPVVVLSNSLGTNFSMWDAQAPELSKKWRVLRYDTRGHGQSLATSGPYSVDQLGRDVLDLATSLSIDKFYFCGLSLGGLTGMWLGINAPDRVHALILCSTGAKIATAEMWNTRIETIRKSGMKSIAQATMERWFTARFREKQPKVVERIKKIFESADVEGYAGCCGALRDADLREGIGAIRAATLVISATHDPATPPSEGHFLRDHIHGARYLELDAAHLSNIEQAEQFTRAVERFMLSQIRAA
jgi:3-oxoadipate enol-lactonase